MADERQGRCPDLGNLARLEELEPNLLMPVEGEPEATRKTKELILLLGLAFNDLKFLSWATHQLEKGHPPDDEFSPYAGEWRGTTETIHRMGAGITLEIGNLLKGYEAIVASPTVRAAIRRSKRMAKSAPAAWKWLVTFANADKKRDRSQVYYRRVRHDLGYHYQYGGDAILKGYRSHFTKRPITPSNQYAYASLGSDQAESRFFFSDAAAQGSVRALIASLGIPEASLRQHFVAINVAIRFVVEALIQELKESQVRSAT